MTTAISIVTFVYGGLAIIFALFVLFHKPTKEISKNALRNFFILPEKKEEVKEVKWIIRREIRIHMTNEDVYTWDHVNDEMYQKFVKWFHGRPQSDTLAFTDPDGHVGLVRHRIRTYQVVNKKEKI